jgi:hypothetical protein
MLTLRTNRELRWPVDYEFNVDSFGTFMIKDCLMANRPQLLQYLGNKCARCSKSVEEMIKRYGDVHRIFKFHHVDPDQKSDNYANLIRRDISTETLDEIDKCILLCGECHDILHAQSIDGQVKFTVTVGGRTAEQTVSGNFVVDSIDNVLTFLTNERVYVVPYLMQVGEDGTPELVFGTELNDGKILKQLASLRESKIMKLFSVPDRRKMFQATLTERGSVLMKFDVGLQLPLSIDPAPKNNEPVQGWFRNGVALRSDGLVVTSGTITIDITHPSFL